MTNLNAKLIFPYKNNGYSVRNGESESRIKLVGMAERGRCFFLNFEPKTDELCDMVSEDFLEVYPFNVHNSLNDCFSFSSTFGFVIGMKWSNDSKKSDAILEVRYIPAWFTYLS